MLRWKTTLALFLATVVVGAYVSLYELKQPTPEERQARSKQVVRLSPTEVTWLRVECPEATVTLERHSDSSWRLTAPISARAEESLAQRILDALDPLEAERVLEGSTDKPLSVGDYGLEPPRGKLSVKAGQQETVLLFGESTAVGSHRYLKRADSPNIFVTGTQLFDAVNQPLETYRSHEVLVFNTWEVRRIAVASSQSSCTLTKDGERWRLTEPFGDEAEGAAVSAILSKLRGLRAERIETETSQADALAERGLDPPVTRITVFLGQDAKPLELLVGKLTRDNAAHLYVKRTDEPTVYTVDNSRVDELLQDPQTLRSHAVFDVAPGQLAKLRLNWQDQSWTIEQDEGKWRHTETHTALETSNVEEFVWKLHDLKLARFIEGAADATGYGLNPPNGMIQVWLTGEAEPKQLAVGEIIQGGQARYGRIGERPGIVELPPTINDLLATTPDSLKTLPANSAPTPQQPPIKP